MILKNIMGWRPVSLMFFSCDNMLLQMENLKETGSHPINSRCPQFRKALSPTSDGVRRSSYMQNPIARANRLDGIYYGHKERL